MITAGVERAIRRMNNTVYRWMIARLDALIMLTVRESSIGLVLTQSTPLLRLLAGTARNSQPQNHIMKKRMH